ncbi:MAG: putative quinol monooxygenase [Thermomicrobiales bacterium]
MYVVVARFTALPLASDTVAGLLAEMIPHALAEPGCHGYAVNRMVDDPSVFLLYEQYTDEAAFAVHRETEPFKRIILSQVVPLLADRQREIYDLLQPAAAGTEQ